MAASDAILKRLLALHPKIIDLKLDRMWRILRKLGNPERGLPPVIHVAGTNGKGSTIAYLRAVLEAAGLGVHCYTSPHLVRFHERIRIGHTGGGELVSEPYLGELLEECELANGGAPITFFEITTAAAFLAFARNPADYLLLEVGLGGRLDATNVVSAPELTVITAVDLDHQQYLGDTLAEIASEKAGILKPGVTAVIGAQADEAYDQIEAIALAKGAPLFAANRQWQCFEQQGRLVFTDEEGLLDLPLPGLPGRHQIDNAGNAIAALRVLKDRRVGETHIAKGLRAAQWPARLQRLGPGQLSALLPEGAELWLDGGHNPAAGRALSASVSELNERVSRPLILVWGMLNTKAAQEFIAPFRGLAQGVVTVKIPGEVNALPADALAEAAMASGLKAEAADSLPDALSRAGRLAEAPRVLICGSLYLAGQVLALHHGETGSAVSGASRR